MGVTGLELPKAGLYGKLIDADVEVTSLGEDMSANSLVCLGGGPAGLALARLTKMAEPSWDVTVYERGASDAVVGFGIGLGDKAMRSLADVDPQTHRRLVEAGVAGQGMELRHRGSTIRWGDRGGTAIARQSLLTILREQATDIGVAVRMGEEAALDSVRAGASVVVAADGVHSATRERLRDRLRVAERPSNSMYIWFGARLDLDSMTFSFVENEHGLWAAHAYPYAPGLATFLVETDLATWRSAALQDSTAVEAGGSDDDSRRYLEDLFKQDLGGAPLLANNSRWSTFRNIRCERWSADNVVLIGDAAHTAHFSVGSGTSLALEDAISLASALVHNPTPTEAFVEYESARRPAVEQLQMRADASRLWWESVGSRVDFRAEELAFHYMTRTGALSFERVRAAYPAFAHAVRARFDDVTTDATGAVFDVDDALFAPARVSDVILPSRVVVTKKPIVAADSFDGDAQMIFFGGLALSGAGMVVVDFEDEVSANGRPSSWREIAHFVDRASSALLGVRVPLDSSELLAEVAETGFGYLELICDGIAANSVRYRKLCDTVALLRRDHEHVKLIGLDIGCPDVEPYSPLADELAGLLGRLAELGVGVVRLRTAGSLPVHRVQTMQLAEQIRRASGVALLACGADYSQEQLRTEVLAARIDLAECWPTDIPQLKRSATSLAVVAKDA